MSASLRDLAQRANALPLTHFDAADLMRQGEARLLRRRLGVVAGTAVALVLAAGLAGSALSGSERAQVPADGPSPTRTESAWTPERVRAEGTLGETMLATESGLAARTYVACDARPCDPSDVRPEDMHAVLEVSQNGRSAVFDLHWEVYPWVSAFDEDTVLVQDRRNGESQESARYRLLQADGSALQLQVVDDPAPAVPGPDLVVIPRSSILVGTGRVFLVDDRAGTLRPLDVPEEIRYWGSNVDEFLWGVADDCRVFWAVGGTMRAHELDCAKDLDFTYGISPDEFPPGWLQPGRMAVGEQRGGQGEIRNFVHASLDGGATWQRIPVRDDDFADVFDRIG